MIDPPEAIIFDTPFLELFTKTPWYAIPLIWIPVVFYLCYSAKVEDGINYPQLLACFAIGLFLWTLVEYFLHRFVFHIDNYLPDNRYALLLHYTLHGIHHAFPMDANRLVFPPLLAIPLMILFHTLYRGMFNDFGTAVFAGTMMGYISYDMMHFFLHHTTSACKYFKFLKKYHILHHYKSSDLGFGVSQHLWDKVFDTVLVSEEENTK